jgi:aconitate decarboxylase
VRVEVHLKDGFVDTETREAPRGSEQSFASEQDIVDKFRKLAAGIMPKAQQDDVIDIVLNMEKVEDIGRLPKALQAN